MLKDVIDELTVLIDPLITVLSDVSPEMREDISLLRELLIWERDVLEAAAPAGISTWATPPPASVAVTPAPVKLSAVKAVPSVVPSSLTVAIPPPPPPAALSESIRELTVLIDPLITVLTAVLRLLVDEMAPLNELLICESDVLWPVLTEIAPLKELLIWESEVD